MALRTVTRQIEFVAAFEARFGKVSNPKAALAVFPYFMS